MNRKYDVLIFDIYLIYHAKYESEPKQTFRYNGKDIPIHGIIGTLEFINKTIKKYGKKKCKSYYLFDNAKTTMLKHRKDLSPEYKANRPVMSDIFYKMLDSLELILKSYRDNAYLYRVKHLEADDFVHNIIDHYIKSDEKVLLVSTDMDWSRSLATNTDQLIDGRIFSMESFREKYQFEPSYSAIVMYKAFYGDASDNILPAVPNLPKMMFRDFIKHSNSIYMFFQKLNEGFFTFFDTDSGLNWKEKINKEKDKLILNYQLAESPNFKDIELKSWQYNCKYQERKLKLLYTAFGLEGIDERIEFEDNAKKSFLDNFLDQGNIRRK